MYHWSVLCSFRRSDDLIQADERARPHRTNLGWTVAFVLLPILNYVARVSNDGSISAWSWLALATTLGLHTIFNICGAGQSSLPSSFLGEMSSLLSCPVIMILVVCAAPSPRTLGKLQGVSTATGALARAAGPTLASALFALSQSSSPASPSPPSHEGAPLPSSSAKILGGHLWWVVLLAAALVSGAIGWTVKDGEEGTRRMSTRVAIGSESTSSRGRANDEGRASALDSHQTYLELGQRGVVR